MYDKDIRRRQQNKIILTQIYTPTFTPFIYTKKENIKKNKNKQEKNENYKPQTGRNHYYHEEKDDDKDSFSSKDKNNFNTYYYYNQKNNDKFYDNLFENIYENKYEDDEEKKKGRYKKISNSQKHFKKIEKFPKNGSKKSMKSEKYLNNKGSYSDNEDEDAERIAIENAFRYKLFKHKK